MFSLPQQGQKGNPGSPLSHPSNTHSKKSTNEEPFLLTATSNLLPESSHSKKGKYTGCNCSKSQCLKMYCDCFSVGRMCDEVPVCPYRPASARTVKTAAITWTALKQSARSSISTPWPSPARPRRRRPPRQSVIAGNRPASRNIASASEMENNADRVASARAA